MYIQQKPLFSFNDLMKYQPKSRLEIIFSKLDLTPVIKELPSRNLIGPNGYSYKALIRALLAKTILSIPTFTALVEQLQDNILLRYVCGFDVIGTTPSVATISRFYTKLAGSEAMYALFDSLVNKAETDGILQKNIVAIDSSSIASYEHYQKKEDDGTHAMWGYKKDSKGRDYKWYGYKLHLAVDVESGLPTAFTVTPANTADSEQAIPLMELMKYQPAYYCMDKGYDAAKIYNAVNELGGQAIIPLNKRNEKTPLEGMNEEHWPVCSMGYPMVYWGAEKERNSVKFRCPHTCGHKDCCMGSNWCSGSDFGYSIRLYQKDDPRHINLPYRNTANWKKIYKTRGAVERFFGYIKENLMAENIHIQGRNKVTTHLLLCCTAAMIINITMR